MRLRALKSWIDTSLDNYDSVDVTDFDGETCKNLQCKLARKTRGDSSSTGSSMEGKSSDGTGMKLSVFDGKPENWEDSKRNLIAKLNQMKNSEGVPLYYVIRSDDEEENYRKEHGEIGNKIYDAVHFGRQYDQDAFKVLQILKEWTSSGTATTHVESEYNVQTAWDNLKINYEGSDAKQAIIQKARNDIKNAHFTRETVNFKFNDYCICHLHANNWLD